MRDSSSFKVTDEDIDDDGPDCEIDGDGRCRILLAWGKNERGELNVFGLDVVPLLK